jgi:hypothetical protein
VAARATRTWAGFWAWYERNYRLNVAVASVLFLLQLAHLYWLAADPIATRLTGDGFLHLDGLVQWLIFFVDYTEIPALIAVSLVYVNELRRGFAWGPLLFLMFLNSQWLHIFWITDEYVAQAGGFPGGLAWVAILIDYLELPVIFDTLRRLWLTFAGRVPGEHAGSDRRPLGSPEPVRSR